MLWIRYRPSETTSVLRSAILHFSIRLLPNPREENENHPYDCIGDVEKRRF